MAPVAGGVVGSSQRSRMAGRHLRRSRGRRGHRAELHARAAPALSREGAPEPRRLRADAGAEQLRVRPADDRHGDRAQPRRRRLPAASSPTPRCSRRSPTPATRPSWPATTSSSTCRRARCRATAAIELEDELRASLNAGGRRGARNAAPTSWRSASCRRSCRSTSRGSGSAPTTATPRSTTRSSTPAARTSTSTSRGPRGSAWRPTATRSPPSPPAPASSCTCRWHPRTSPPTGTPRRRWSPRRSPWPPTRRSSSASGCTPRRGSSCSARPPTPAASS